MDHDMPLLESVFPRHAQLLDPHATLSETDIDDLYSSCDKLPQYDQEEKKRFERRKSLKIFKMFSLQFNHCNSFYSFTNGFIVRKNEKMVDLQTLLR